MRKKDEKKVVECTDGTDPDIPVPGTRHWVMSLKKEVIHRIDRLL